VTKEDDMRRQISTLVLAGLLGGALVATTAAAQAPPTTAPAPKADKQHMMGRLQQRLGLTPEQVQAFQAAHQRQHETMKQLFPALRQARIDLRQLALNGGADDAIQAKAQEVQRLTNDMLQARVKALQEVAPILTPEQREKLAQIEYQGGRHRGPRGPRPS
jgi:Spy/CpxP family protein refolding chaperone